jgi:hypothetical protein
MHFLYIDEAGSTGEDLKAAQQPVFIMASLVVSDEKWRKTTRIIREKLEAYFNAELPAGFELHACELLSPDGEGPFAGHERDRRNKLALELLELIGTRGHYVFHVPVYKSKLEGLGAPEKDFGFNWHHPWHFGFAMQITMFEEFLRGPDTGSTSTGLAIVDHEDAYVDFVRFHTGERQAVTGWKQLKKVVEIGYSASSHANPLIQLADLVAFTLKKYYELKNPMSENWPEPAKEFFTACRDSVWPRVKFKNPSFKKLNVHACMLDHAKAIRKP